MDERHKATEATEELAARLRNVFDNPNHPWFWFDMHTLAADVKKLVHTGAKISKIYLRFRGKQDSLLRTLIYVEAGDRFELPRRRERRIEPLLAQVVQHLDAKSLRGAMFYAMIWHDLGHGASCSCVEQNRNVIRYLLQAGAYMPRSSIIQCAVVREFADMICSAQAACFCFLMIRKHCYVAGLDNVPRDVMLMICKEVWSTRRLAKVWGDKVRRSERIKRIKRK